MRVFITNDDGINSPGLVPLAHAALDAGHEVIVAAPNVEYSGASVSLTGEPEGDGFKVSQGRPVGLSEEAESIAVHASPAMIAYGAALESFGPRPDILLSGVNLGPNVGPAVMHSGTVGAALTAAAMRIPALATSMSRMRPVHWDTAQFIVTKILDDVSRLPLDGRVLNLNIPDVDLTELRGLQAAFIGKYADTPEAAATQVQLLLGGKAIEGLSKQFAEGSDGRLLSQNWAAISLVRGPQHAADGFTLPTFAL